jgi:hypothetical protein
VGVEVLGGGVDEEEAEDFREEFGGRAPVLGVDDAVVELDGYTT